MNVNFEEMIMFDAADGGATISTYKLSVEKDLLGMRYPNGGFYVLEEHFQHAYKQWLASRIVGGEVDEHNTALFV